MAEILKEKARDELVRITEKEQSCLIGTLSSKAQSIAATKFYIKEIHNPQKVFIEDDDITQGLVDGANDLGCDFINRDDGRS